jgi:hypothetical protein
MGAAAAAAQGGQREMPPSSFVHPAGAAGAMFPSDSSLPYTTSIHTPQPPTACYVAAQLHPLCSIHVCLCTGAASAMFPSGRSLPDLTRCPHAPAIMLCCDGRYVCRLQVRPAPCSHRAGPCQILPPSACHSRQLASTPPAHQSPSPPAHPSSLAEQQQPLGLWRTRLHATD